MAHQRSISSASEHRRQRRASQNSPAEARRAAVSSCSSEADHERSSMQSDLINKAPLFISPHVVERWMQRVDPHLSEAQAKSIVRQFAKAARKVEKRPSWLKGRRRPNTWYVLSPEWPGVVGVGVGRVLKTVVARNSAGEFGRVGATVRIVMAPQGGVR